MSNPQWYYLDVQDQQTGPVTAEELKQVAGQGLIHSETQVWTEGLEAWIPASNVEGLISQPEPTASQPIIAPTTPMIASTPTTQPIQGTAVGAIGSNAYASPQTDSTPEAGTADYPATIKKGGSFGLYLGLLLGSLALFVVGSIIGNKGDAGAIIALILLLSGLAGLVIFSILQYVYLYRAWACLQPGGATITPGKAVGFMFIPLFGTIWFFIAIGGLPKQWNKIMDAYPNTQRAPRLSFASFMMMLFIPVIGALIWAHELIKGLNFMASIGKPDLGGGTASTLGGGGGLNFGPTTIPVKR